MQGAKGFFVWIVDKDNKAQVRNVSVGSWQGDNWFILKGLSAGDRVVTDGIIHLSSGLPVNIVTPADGNKPDDQKAASD